MATTSMSSLDGLREDFQKNKEKILEEFFTFLRFASISSEAAYSSEVEKCSDWLANYLREIGFSVEKWPTPGHPTLFAHHCHAGDDKPTLLIYNHYDVQPVDPLGAWTSPPFEPEIRQGQIFARGAQDNKGQCFFVLQALKALITRDGGLPINVKLCIEGEEECGSAGLAAILESRKNQLSADALAIVDVGLRAPDLPAVTVGLRGLVTMDLSIKGSKTDLHSGSHGGLAYNPLRALAELLANLYREDGSIAVPNFYDSIIPITEAEKAQICLDFDATEYEQCFGMVPTGGEQRLSPLERNWLRPTIEINGITGGYSGPGMKTVIPAEASAKLSCRLVLGQQPRATAQLVANFLQDRAPEGITVSVDIHPGGGPAVRTSLDSLPVAAFAKAYQEVFNKECSYILEGASIPVVTALAEASGAETVLLGMALSTDNIHAPNEHFGIDRMEQGMLVIARAIELLGKR
jgi:acetylornithine deacetylase/succinyl-diaminopimelate desuccinylase-like protein